MLSFALCGMDFDDKDLSLMGRVARRVEELGNPRTRHAEMAQPIVRGSHQYEEENKHVGRLQHLHYSSPMLEELGRGQHFWDMDQHFQRQQRQQLMLYLQPHCLIEEATRMHGHDINLLLSGDCSFVPMAPQLVQYDHALSTTPERSFAESRNIALSWPRLQSSTRLLNPSVSFQSDAAAAATESLTVSENVCHNGAHLVGRNHDVSISTGDSFTIDVPKPSCSQLLKGTKKKSRVNFASLHGQQVSTPSHPSIIGGSLDGPRVAPPIHAYSARAGINEELFPVKLHAILTNPDYHDIIGWHPHGKSWKVFQATLFEEIVSPRFFRQTKFASFMRQGRTTKCYPDDIL